MKAADIKDTGAIPGSGRTPWRRKWQTTTVFLPREFHGQNPWGHKKSDTTEQLIQQQGGKSQMITTSYQKP